LVIFGDGFLLAVSRFTFCFTFHFSFHFQRSFSINGKSVNGGRIVAL